MCVIIVLPSNTIIDKTQLTNAVHNNWHGFGLILKDGNGRIQVIKEFSEDGTDPEKVWKLLEDNKDIERFLHLRHSTKGTIDESNVQPFNIYNSSSRQVWFAHNGTLTSFGGAWNSKDGKSDTLDFCDKILSPALLHWNGKSGPADYNSEDFYKLIIDKHWTGGSTGLFVSNDLDFMCIGNSWSTYKNPVTKEDTKILVSNTLYFDRIQRGPTFLKLEAEKKKEEEQKRKEALKDSPFLDNNHGGGNSQSFHTINYTPALFNKDLRIIKAINDVLDTWDINDPERLANVTEATYDEIHDVLLGMDEWTITALFHCFIEQLSELKKENNKLKISKDKAEKRIREFNTNLKNKNGVKDGKAA